MNGLNHAVVLGASYAGLLGAAVLAKRFAKVTLVERDELADAAVPRKGVPQSRMPHVLLGAGAEVLERLLPGLRKSLVAGGAIEYRFGKESLMSYLGRFHQSYENGPLNVSLTRGYLEMHVRRRVLSLRNVELVRASVRGLGLSADGTRVSQVSLESRDGGGESSLEADLVVDATGRGSVSPRWLRELGCGAPEETAVKFRGGGAARFYTSGRSQLPWKVVMLVRCGADGKRVVYLARVEPEAGSTRDRWFMCVGGWCGEYPNDKTDDFDSYLDAMQLPVIADFVRDAEVLTEPQFMTFSKSVWRHYEKMKALPNGFVVMGDAFCALNPHYGQGMTMAAIEASILDECLESQARKRSGSTDDAVRAYYSRAGRRLADAWGMSAELDLQWPEVEGERSLQTKVAGFVNDFIVEAAAQDSEVDRVLTEVANMTRSPLVLMRPDLLWRIFRAKAGVRPRVEAAPDRSGETCRASPDGKRHAHEVSKVSRGW